MPSPTSPSTTLAFESHGPLPGRFVYGKRLRLSLRLITIAWLFGSVWVTATAGAPFTRFAEGLGVNHFQFGLLSSLPYLAALLSLAGTVLVERTGRRKAIFLIGLLEMRVLWFAIALVPVWAFYRVGHAFAVWAFLTLVLLMNGGQGVGGVAWNSWMADIVPERVRGKYFSRRRQWGIVAAIPTALAAGWMLDHHTRAGNHGVLITCGLLFMAAAIFGIADIALFFGVPDVPKPPRQGEGLLRSLAVPLRNRSFLWASGFVAVITFAMTFMNQFVTLYLIDRVHATNTQVQMMLLIAPYVAQLLLLPVWGLAADRMGKKPLLILSGIGMVLPGLGWSFTMPQTLWVGYLVSAVGAGLYVGIEVANFNLTLELSGQGESADGEPGSSSYFALNAIAINVAGCLGGVAAGGIAQALGSWQWTAPVWFPLSKTFTYFDVLFVLSAVLRLASVAMFLPHIHEPTARPTVEALRFMTTNVYNNVVGAVLQPVRLVRRRAGNK